MSQVTVIDQNRRDVSHSRQVVLWLSRHWLAVFNIAWGIFVILPWLAPILMRLGLTGPAQAIYFGYSFVCHQLPERSYFLFGSQVTYPLAQINHVWPGANNPLTLRRFIGGAQFGYKVAWSDRMVSLYTGLWLGSLIFALVRRRMKPISLWTYTLLALPMAVDGTSHLISDLSGIGQGFRDSNEWLAALTHHALPAWFYAGDALGSFNSWMRLITGLLFGLGTVALLLPYLEQSFAQMREQLERAA
jgi:uncharacterized membrane protein